jgi:hypothetical protein
MCKQIERNSLRQSATNGMTERHPLKSQIPDEGKLIYIKLNIPQLARHLLSTIRVES